MDEVTRAVDGREVLEMKWSRDGAKLCVIVALSPLPLPTGVSPPDTAVLWAQVEGRRAVKARRRGKRELGEVEGESVVEYLDGSREVALLFELVAGCMLPALPGWRP